MQRVPQALEHSRRASCPESLSWERKVQDRTGTQSQRQLPKVPWNRSPKQQYVPTAKSRVAALTHPSLESELSYKAANPLSSLLDPHSTTVSQPTVATSAHLDVYGLCLARRIGEYPEKLNITLQPFAQTAYHASLCCLMWSHLFKRSYIDEHLDHSKIIREASLPMSAHQYAHLLLSSWTRATLD